VILVGAAGVIVLGAALTWWATGENPSPAGSTPVRPIARTVPTAAPPMGAENPVKATADPVPPVAAPTTAQTSIPVPSQAAKPTTEKNQASINRTATKTSKPATSTQGSSQASQGESNLVATLAATLKEGEDAFRRNQLVQAKMLADKAIAIAPTVEAYLLLGKVLLAREMPVEAVAIYRKALKLDRNNENAKRGLLKAESEAQSAAAP
jgi:hypothetical protein